MKRLVVFYSLSGNTKEAAEKIAGGLGADILHGPLSRFRTN